MHTFRHVRTHPHNVHMRVLMRMHTHTPHYSFNGFLAQKPS